MEGERRPSKKNSQKENKKHPYKRKTKNHNPHIVSQSDEIANNYEDTEPEDSTLCKNNVGEASSGSVIFQRSLKTLKDLMKTKLTNEWECSNCDMMNDGDNPFCRDCDRESYEREELKQEIKKEILEELRNEN